MTAFPSGTDTDLLGAGIFKALQMAVVIELLM